MLHSNGKFFKVIVAVIVAIVMMGYQTIVASAASSQKDVPLQKTKVIEKEVHYFRDGIGKKTIILAKTKVVNGKRMCAKKDDEPRRSIRNKPNHVAPCMFRHIPASQ